MKMSSEAELEAESSAAERSLKMVHQNRAL